MNSKKLQYTFFTSLVILSISSSLYLNNEAKNIPTQNEKVSKIIPSAESDVFLPDLKILDQALSKLKESILLP